MTIIQLHRSPEGDEGAGGPGLSLADITGNTEGVATDLDKKEGVTDLSQAGINPLPGTSADTSTGTGTEEPNADTENADAAETEKPVEEIPAETTDSGEYFSEVEKITGIHYDVQYPEGSDADFALTPQGIAHRDKAVREHAQQELDEYLRVTFPRAYSFYEHMAAGRPEKEFFESAPAFNLPTLEEMKASPEMQKEVYMQALRAAGNDKEEAEALVEGAIKNNKLSEKAITAHGKIDKEQKDALASLEKENVRIAKQEQDAMESTKTGISKMINDSQLGWIVPEASRKEFESFVLNHMQYDPASGKTFVVIESGTDNMQKTLETMLFHYKKGNMKDLLEQKAGTVAAQKLRLNNQKAIKTDISGQRQQTNGNEYISLSDIAGHKRD